MGVTVQGPHKGHVWWKCPYVAYINVSITAVICTPFARCYHWKKLGKGYMGCLSIISYSCMQIYSYLKIKRLIKNNQLVWIYLTRTFSLGQEMFTLCRKQHRISKRRKRWRQKRKRQQWKEQLLRNKKGLLSIKNQGNKSFHSRPILP